MKKSLQGWCSGQSAGAETADIGMACHPHNITCWGEKESCLSVTWVTRSFFFSGFWMKGWVFFLEVSYNLMFYSKNISVPTKWREVRAGRSLGCCRENNLISQKLKKQLWHNNEKTNLNFNATQAVEWWNLPTALDDSLNDDLIIIEANGFPDHCRTQRFG